MFKLFQITVSDYPPKMLPELVTLLNIGVEALAAVLPGYLLGGGVSGDS